MSYPKNGTTSSLLTTQLLTYNQITGDYTRLFLITYCLIVFVVGVTANMFVTYSTTNYRSIRFDKWGLILTKNLSIADGLYAVFVVFPVLINNLGKQWVFGDVMCIWAAGLKFIFMLASTNFLTAVSLHRLIQGLNPLRDYITLTRNSVGVSLIIWTYSSLVTIRMLSFRNFYVRFDPEIAFCSFHGYRTSCENFIFTTVMLLIPFCIIIVSHLGLYHISKNQLARSRKIRQQSVNAASLGARKREGRSMQRTLKTLGSLSALLVVSWLPNIVNHLVLLEADACRPFRRAVMYLYFLNTSGNPILYTLVNRDFKNYAKRQLVSMISKDFTETNPRGPNRTYTARLSPLSAGNSSYIRPIKSSIL